MFDFLTSTFSNIFSKLSGAKTIDEATITSVLDQIRHALLDADVPYDLVETFIRSVREEAVSVQISKSLKPADQLVKIVHDKLVQFLGGEQEKQFEFASPGIVMVMGLQGSGKTTTIGKLAHYVLKNAAKNNKRRKIVLASVDYYRPAAIDQLHVLAQRIGVSFYRAHAQDPVAAAREIYDHYQKEKFDLLFLDTAGRLHVDNTMLQELRDIDNALNPAHKLLVLDAMTGQESLAVAQAFDQGVGFQAAILSKSDSDTRGGASISFRYALKKPIIFVGTGEKPADLDQFHPTRMAQRILGMGDIQTLLEKADDTIKKSDQERMEKVFGTDAFTLEDFAKQLDMMGRLGSLSGLTKYIPGMGGLKIDSAALEQGERELKRFRAIINSMTHKERIYPKLLNASSRRQRIAQGAGVSVAEVNKLLQRFEEMQQYAKLLKKSGPGGFFRGR